MKKLENKNILAVRELISKTAKTTSQAVVVGFNWTMVEGIDGVGLTTTPSKQLYGVETTKDTGTLTGRSLQELAEFSLSKNPYERSIGCAAINASLNRFDISVQNRNGMTRQPQDDTNVVIVGRFPNLAKTFPFATVLEREPGPGDLPAEAAIDVIPKCTRLIITASAWVNATLENLIQLGTNAHITLIGPGTPLSPELYSHGIDRLAGFVVTRRKQFRQAIAEGAGVRQFRQLGRYVIMDKNIKI